MPTALAAEASVIRQGRTGAYADMEHALSTAAASGVSSLTITHARNLLSRHVATQRRYAWPADG